MGNPPSAFSDPTGWFESIYANASGNAQAVPWANMAPYPAFVAWADQNQIRGNGREALVVACGLGDDAEALAARGFAVTAFDVSPTAIAWCQRRFPGSSVAYHVADLFHTGQDWHARFAFVLEVRTIQSVPPELHALAMQQVAQFPAPGGDLLVISHGRSPETPVSGPPWPLTKMELDAFPRAGLREITFDEIPLGGQPPLWTYRAHYRRP